LGRWLDRGSTRVATSKWREFGREGEREGLERKFLNMKFCSETFGWGWEAVIELARGGGKKGIARGGIMNRSQVELWKGGRGNGDCWKYSRVSGGINEVKQAQHTGKGGKARGAKRKEA